MTGEKITNQYGKITVPDFPIVPFIEGDGTGPDIWAASNKVLDAAVEKLSGKKFMLERKHLTIQENGYPKRRWIPFESTW